MSRTFRSDLYEEDYHYKGKSSRDKKKWYKADSGTKRLNKRKERAKTHDSLRHITENEDALVPEFKRHNDADWKDSHPYK